MADSVTQKKGDLTNVCNTCDCIKIDLKKPFVIATAKDNEATKRGSGGTPFKSDVPDDAPMTFGDDLDYGPAAGQAAPAMANGQPSAGSDVGTLKTQMNGLLPVFAGNDTDGNAKKLFDDFLKPNKGVELYHDDNLDKAAGKAENFDAFANLTLNSPINSPRSGARRIHQALKEAGWDINAVKRIDGLGILAFKTDADRSNGLFVMVDGVQYVFVHVTSYHYDSCKHQYTITLEFHLYDVFGLDAEDVGTYGKGGSFSGPFAYKELWPSVGEATTGISSWWQLQHQHGYPPLVTKIVVKRTWTVPTDAIETLDPPDQGVPFIGP